MYSYYRGWGLNEEQEEQAPDEPLFMRVRRVPLKKSLEEQEEQN